METINDIILNYLSSFSDTRNGGRSVKSFLESWLCLTLIAQININKHSYKNKNDKDKLEFLFKDFKANIAAILNDKDNIAKLKNILDIVESGCPILITKFDDIKETMSKAEGIGDLKEKELDYFMDCTVSLIHLGKNKLFKSFSLDSLAEDYSNFDIIFCENASILIYNIIKAVIAPSVQTFRISPKGSEA
ncbi:MAG: hypothetical protein EVJ47_08055 [Candidatus Acidulodesulfobacterium ferriphilum]|jgi:hypothetical protein|uniref:Uncharacterized protein n=1 Tax=Candidatus Acidulodesulfobacterium ferriphilum TaxID=2597223 RepID=A0A519BA67_9DELT|nr:MAG: hypothetical protein EVJ47_08055 [Candidatus Acidulodesulfobacterium ferriphilum]